MMNRRTISTELSFSRSTSKRHIDASEEPRILPMILVTALKTTRRRSERNVQISKMNRKEGVQRGLRDVNHVVILGAGASVASAVRDPEPSGKRLPTMDSLIDDLELGNVIRSLPADFTTSNFEEVFSSLYERDPDSTTLHEITNRVTEYFESMALPAKPTIYD